MIDPPLSETELCPPELLAEQEAAFERDVARLLARQDEFLAVPCPACGADAGRLAIAKWGFAWKRCHGCGTLYMSPRPSPAVMADYYRDSDNYRIWADAIFPASEIARREKIHRPWLARILDLAEVHGARTGTLVEVGPGFGTFSALAAESGAFERVVAVEPTPQLADACRARGVEVVEARIEDAGELLPTPDVIVAFEVVEHLFAPAEVIRGCAEAMEPGGLLVLSCPNGEGFDIATLGAASLAVDPEHVNLFTPRALAGLLESSGFAPVWTGTPGRLDAEFVRDAVLGGEASLDGQPFLQRVLIDEWERLGGPFQRFLADNDLSSHMWIAARRV